MSKTTVDTIAKFIGQSDKRLINQMLNSLDFIKQVRVIRNASLNGTLLPKMTVAKGIRNLNLNVTERGEGQRNWSGRKGFPYPGMKIIDMVPEELYNTFMSDMLAPGAKQVPFAQWVWEQEFAKIASEINDAIYLNTYHGDAAAWAAGSIYTGGTDYVNFGANQDIYKCVTTTAAGESPTTTPAKWSLVNELIISDGWGTIIAAEITAGNIAGANLIATGAITNANAVTKVEDMYKSMTIAHQNIGGTFKVSSDVYRKYLEHMRTMYPYFVAPKSGEEPLTVFGDSKWTIEKCTWMGTSQRIIATQIDNLAFLTNLEGDAAKVAKTIETLHGSKSVVKWNQGCQICDLETIYVNNQA